jgi:hypothetical protein
LEKSLSAAGEKEPRKPLRISAKRTARSFMPMKVFEKFRTAHKFEKTSKF